MRTRKPPMDPIIQTYTGREFNLLYPTPEMVHIDDLIRATSRLPRFTGHGDACGTYSVLDHSVGCYTIAREFYGDNESYATLVHDLHEAYYGDVSSPLKSLIPDYRKLERRGAKAVAQHFGVSTKFPKWIDETMLVIEAIEFLGAGTKEKLIPSWYNVVKSVRDREEYTQASEIAREFIKSFSARDSSWIMFINLSKLERESGYVGSPSPILTGN